MIMHMKHPIVGVALALLAGAACAQAACDARAKAESEAVTRDFSARSPGKGTGPAQQEWAQGLHEALKAVEQRHAACRRANTAVPDAAQERQRDACLDANRRQFEVLDKRYQGRALSVQEQAQLRSEQQKLLDARGACTLRK